MKIKQNLVSPSNYSKKCPYDMVPQYVTFHNTYNDAPAADEVAYMIRNTNPVSFHVAVDDKEVIQGIPFNRNAWHCGDGNGSGNRKSIGVEICYSKLGGNNSKFKAAETNAVIVCANLLKTYNLGIDRLKPHKFWSGKNCPHATNHSEFIARVKAELEGKSSGSYTVKITADTLNVRSGPGTNYKVNTTVKKGQVYTIVQESNGWGKLKSGAGWISLVYTSKSTVTNPIKVGSKVKITGSKYATGQNIPKWAKNTTYTVSKLDKDKALIKEITSWVYLRDLKIE